MNEGSPEFLVNRACYVSGCDAECVGMETETATVHWCAAGHVTISECHQKDASDFTTEHVHSF